MDSSEEVRSKREREWREKHISGKKIIQLIDAKVFSSIKTSYTKKEDKIFKWVIPFSSPIISFTLKNTVTESMLLIQK